MLKKNAVAAETAAPKVIVIITDGRIDAHQVGPAPYRLKSHLLLLVAS